MLAEAKAASERFAAEELIDVDWERIWSIEPILFDETFIGFCKEAIREVAGTTYHFRLARSTTPPRCRAPVSRR